MFAVGLILQEILVNTTNEKGEMIFIDRTDPLNGILIRKLLLLLKLIRKYQKK